LSADKSNSPVPSPHKESANQLTPRPPSANKKSRPLSANKKTSRPASANQNAPLTEEATPGTSKEDKDKKSTGKPSFKAVGLTADLVTTPVKQKQNPKSKACILM